MMLNNIKILALVTALILPVLSSCSTVSPSDSSQGQTLDPRFIGTWAGQTHFRGKKRDVVMSLAPDGKGAVHARVDGKFEKAQVKWSTRSTVLELREEVNALHKFVFGDSGYVKVENPNSYRKRYKTIPPALGNVRLYSVTEFHETRFLASELARPGNKSFFYKYNKAPFKDPYPAFSWYDSNEFAKIPR